MTIEERRKYHREWQRQWRAKNPERWRAIRNKSVAKHYRNNKDKVLAAQKRRRESIKQLIRELKDRPCTDCGVKYPSYVMEFDHLSDKVRSISDFAHRGYSMDVIKAEIAKCELVCSNCHRVRTYLRKAQSSDATLSTLETELG